MFLLCHQIFSLQREKQFRVNDKVICDTRIKNVWDMLHKNRLRKYMLQTNKWRKDMLHMNRLYRDMLHTNK